ncbi:MAG: 2-C-methyl-D-erythritol 4-phosphate cytidylyltransferase [Candidatus Omnitrophica bacterium]|nr:2-C-methyl-D-erythritol 4-phosphate cytidylyltransferase [Candidatus Omnitrophota bacterium]
MEYVSAIVLAAGRGLRFSRPNSFTPGGGIPPSVRRYAGRAKVSKPLVKIDSQPLIIYCLKTLSSHLYIKDIVLVVNAENKEAIVREIARYKITKIKRVVMGGPRRQDSVKSGLKAQGAYADLVLIHDAARPFIDKGMVGSVIREAQTCGAAIVGVPVKATIKQVIRSGGQEARSRFAVEKTLDRSRLWEIQTPQVFKKDLILRAYKKFASHTEVTDDAMLVERLGVKVSIVLGSYNNIKITTPEDLVLAQGIAKKWNIG